MRIARVVLNNVKSYADTTTIDLAPGINAVCGENGAGKSTILEAIGFALFGFRPYRLDAFLREGEKSGSIMVTVEDDDGCSFDVVRKLGSGSGQAVYDELGVRVAEGEADVRNWRLNLFGLEPGTDLPKLFEDTIGPPQGTLTSAFLESPADKKDKFDRLLGIRDYPRAADELRAVSNLFRDRAEEAERRAALLEGSVRALPGLEERQTELMRRKAELGVGLAGLTQRQAEMAAARDGFEKAQQAVQRAEAELGLARNRAAESQRRRDEQAAELRRAEEAARLVEESRPGSRAYQEAVELLRQLEVRRRDRDRLRQAAEKAARDALRWEQGVRVAEERLDALSKDDARAAERELLVPEQEGRERSVERARERVRAREEAARQLPAAEERLKAARALLEDATERLAGVERARPAAARLEELRKRDRALRDELAGLEKQGWALKQCREDLEEAAGRLGQLAREWEQLQGEVGRLRPLMSLASSAPELQGKRDAESRGVEAALARKREAERSRGQVEGGLCPFLREPCGNLRPGVSLDAHFDGAIAESGAELERAGARLVLAESELERARSAERAVSRLPDLEQRVALLGGERAKLEQEAERLERLRSELESAPEQLAGVQKSLRQLESELVGAEAAWRVVAGEAGWRRQADDAGQTSEREGQGLVEIRARLERDAGAGDDLVAAQRALAELKDPRAEAAALRQRIARERPGTERALERARSELAVARADEERARAALEPYAQLEDDIAAGTARRDESEAAHRAFLANQGEAERLPRRRVAHEQAVLESGQAAAALVAARHTLEGARATYDETEHLRLRREMDEVAGRIAGARKELEVGQREEERLLRELAELRQAKAEMESARLEATEQRRLRDVVETVRDVLKRAGPEIARALLRRVSARATALYRDLLGQPTVSLEWRADYDICCRVRAEEREFKQLSGGEQMAAALAVRMALMQIIGNLRIAFLDEPTAHMDAVRRVNLAAQIQNLRSFDQLVVISHDDSFDTLFGHVVRLAKRDGVTSLEP